MVLGLIKLVKNSENIPEKMDNKILVPFCLESPLSGVKTFLYENQTLFYDKQFTIPKDWIKKFYFILEQLIVNAHYHYI